MLIFGRIVHEPGNHGNKTVGCSGVMLLPSARSLLNIPFSFPKSLELAFD
jgi:hypothetical protein